MSGLDHELQRWVVEHRAGWLTPLFEAASWAGTWGGLWLVLGLLAAFLRSRWGVLLAAALAVAVAEAAVPALKAAVDRPRPAGGLAEAAALVPAPHSSSFPSGHATTAFAGATVLALALPRAALPACALAVAVAYSRVYLGVHYPGDVLAGAGIGCAIGAVAWLAVRRARRRLPRLGA